MGRELEVKVPDIGDYDSVPVIDVLVKAGDQVEKETPLVTLESDKATMDVPAPEAGIIKSIRIKVGDKVSQGSAVLVLEVGGASPEPGDTQRSAPKAAPEPTRKADGGSPPKADAAPAAPKTPKAASPAASAGKLEVSVPEIGDYHDVPVIEVMVKEGDAVEKDATLLVLESDKATLDVPAPAAGVVRGLQRKVGDKVSRGSAICILETAPATGDPERPQPAASVPAQTSEPAPGKAPGNLGEAPPLPPASPLPATEAQSGAGELPHASPSIRKFARELGVDLARVEGSGPNRRITRDDVQGFVKKSLAAPRATAAGGGIPPIPAIDFSQFGPIETKPLARIRKLSATYLHRAWLNVPHVTQTDDADITDLEAFRKSQSTETGIKLTLLPFVLKACAKALVAYPEFNSSLAPDGENLILKKYIHLGFAADTPNGLVVPVVRDVDKKGVVALAQETAELASKARDGKLKADDMKGGCFSISSLGGIGGSHFTPIVNAPEVAILGVSRASMKPVWDGKAFQPRLLLPLSLSYDHRVIDGAYAARFIVHLVALLSDLRKLVM